MDHFWPYTGHLLEASLDGMRLPYGELADSRAAGERLGGDFTLRVVAEAGDPPGGLAALLLVTDLAQREILLLGPDRADLVLRFRSRGDWVGLEGARIQVPDALRGIAVGQRIHLEVARKGGDLCLKVGGREHCGLGLTLGDGWSLLTPDLPWLVRNRQLLGPLWLGMLLLPLGYWSRPSGSIAAAWAAVTAAMLLAPAATGLLATPLSQAVGAAAGVMAGAAVGRSLRGAT
jgi:hypothetical protein